MGECMFCGRNRFDFLNSIGLPNDLLYNDEHIYVRPDIVSLVAGHLLAITYRHINCYMEASPDEFRSLSLIKHLFNQTHQNNTLFLEHGALFEGQGGASICHAHLHMLPLPLEVSETYIDNYIKTEPNISSDKMDVKDMTLEKLLTLRKSYLYYEMNGNGWFYLVNEVPRQFLRRMFQPFMHYTYDWNANVYNEEAHRNYRDSLKFYHEKGWQ